MLSVTAKTFYLYMSQWSIYLSMYAGIENDEDPDDDGDGILDENDEL